MRESVSPVDQGLLDQAISTHKSWVDVGPYESLSKSQASNGDALAEHFPLLECLLTPQPKGELLLTQVRAAILKVVAVNPKINSTEMKNLLWAGGRYERLSTMLHHLRRCKNSSDKMRQLVAKSSPESVCKVQELLALLATDESTGTTKTEDSAMKKSEPLGSAGITNAGKVVAEPSEAQTDGTGVPSLPTLPKLEGNSQQLAKESLQVETQKKAKKSKKDLATNKVTYRKEFYKATNKFGIKKLKPGHKNKQIFTLGHKGIPKDELEELCRKVLNDLTKHADDSVKEEEIMLLAKHKVWNLGKKHGSGGT